MSRPSLLRTTSARQAGLSLVEMLVSVALFSILSYAVLTTIHNLYRFNAYTFAQAYQVQNARTGMQSLIRDVREMTFADDGTFPLAVMNEHQIGFYSDIDRDDSVEYVQYELVGTSTLEKTIYNATGSPPTYNLTTPDETLILSRYVQNINQSTSTFYYYDDTGASATSSADLTAVRYVRAQLIINVDPIRDPGQFMLRSSAALRNVQENL
jgi:prepilin-type N-terminal cleavage/methylation domain-containing protein